MTEYRVSSSTSLLKCATKRPSDSYCGSTTWAFSAQIGSIPVRKSTYHSDRRPTTPVPVVSKLASRRNTTAHHPQSDTDTVTDVPLTTIATANTHLHRRVLLQSSHSRELSSEVRWDLPITTNRSATTYSITRITAPPASGSPDRSDPVSMSVSTPVTPTRKKLPNPPKHSPSARYRSARTR